MAVSDAVVGNLTTIYVAVIVVIKAYGLICGRSFSGSFVLIVSTTVVGLILIGTLMWDVSRKAAYAFTRDGIRRRRHHGHVMCKGGICWHGVAVRSPASQVRFRLPQQIPYGYGPL
ncbi:putative Transmembrane protein [Quillaja saponaria]|uniref:Transmembrane protein n=1 Tax=Quillaja saponaria TaxID=32244 RepID=A0AAD7M189_QUISA|nr:putative Transmembrane protein [Quillaja saponaria]